MRVAIVVCTLLGYVAIADAFFGYCPLPPQQTTKLVAYDTKTGRPLHPKAKTVKATAEGYEVSFKCQKGYKLVGWTPDYYCFDYGWYPFDLPVCEQRKYCDSRRAPRYGYVYPNPNHPGTSYYKIGTVIRFSCKDGYRLEGESEDRCEKNGLWAINKPPKCVLIKCPYRSPPLNGFVNPKKKEYYFNDMITFSCKKPKYVLIGKPQDKCGKSDKWLINDTPKCQITCDGRDAPENGSVFPDKDRFFVGKTVAFKCDDGYRLQGKPGDVCKPDGEWKINDTPKCILIVCPQRMAPENGFINGVVDPYLPLNKIQFKCEEGYKLNGEEYDTCQKDGTWKENKTPTCEIIPCSDRKPPKNGRIVDPQDEYVPENMITFECKDGYRLVGDDKDTCLLGGKWDINKTPRCILIICKQRDAPDNGKIEETQNPYLPGNTIKFVCDKYYELNGEEVDTCQDDGTWEVDETPTCVQITCAQRDPPANGGINEADIRDPYVPENMITFFCDKYYRLEGEKKDTCQGDGTWEVNKTPRCVQITCTDRKAPKNGELIDDGQDQYLPTDVISFKCNDEYRLEGPDQDRCQEDGTWRVGRDPKCVLILCETYGKPANGGFVLTAPPPDAEGNEKQVLQPGTKMRFFCNKGYILLRGDRPFDKCEEDGTWKYFKLPRCVPLPKKIYYCRYRNAPYNGYIQNKKDKYAVGDKISFTCKDGYASEIKYDACLEYGKWKYGDYGKHPDCQRVKY